MTTTDTGLPTEWTSVLTALTIQDWLELHPNIWSLRVSHTLQAELNYTVRYVVV